MKQPKKDFFLYPDDFDAEGEISILDEADRMESLLKEKIIPQDSDLDDEFDPRPRDDFLINRNEWPALFWLAKEMGIGYQDIITVIKRIRRDEILYKLRYQPKPDGSQREIAAPFGYLKKFQKRISKRVIGHLHPSQNVFGFSGGSLIKAIEAHLQNQSILCVDFKNAFPTVSLNHILNYLHRKNNDANYGEFSFYVAHLIAELTTFQGKLPQGAPTSPRLFDLVCESIDLKLSQLAKNIGGKYSRYADNIFFSIPKPQSEFSKKIMRAIFRIIEGRRRTKEPKFEWHKLRVRSLNDRAVRMLGLNVIDGKIHNTREYKRRMRKAIYHVTWLVDHKMRYYEALEKLYAFKSFARMDTWPVGLSNDYFIMRAKISLMQITDRLSYPWPARYAEHKEKSKEFWREKLGEAYEIAKHKVQGWPDYIEAKFKEVKEQIDQY